MESFTSTLVGDWLLVSASSLVVMGMVRVLFFSRPMQLLVGILVLQAGCLWSLALLAAAMDAPELGGLQFHLLSGLFPPDAIQSSSSALAERLRGMGAAVVVFGLAMQLLALGLLIGIRRRGASLRVGALKAQCDAQWCAAVGAESSTAEAEVAVAAERGSGGPAA